MKHFFNKYGIDASVGACEKYFTKAVETFKIQGNGILDFEKYNIFTYMKDDISRIRDEIAKDNDNVIYSYMLAEAIKENDVQVIKTLSHPKKDLKSEIYDTLPLFALLENVPFMLSEHKELGIPEEVSKATCNMFENQIQDFIDLNQRYGISDYVTWMLGFVKSRIIRVGRFNFEVTKYRCKFDVFENCGKVIIFPNGVNFHKSGQILGSVGCDDENGDFYGVVKETDTSYIGLSVKDGVCLNEKLTLDKTVWKRVLTEGDYVVSVHIPTGGALSPDICDKDIAYGKEIIKKCLCDFKAFYCSSWLLDPQIKKITGKESNVTKFGDRFERFPKKDGGKSVYEYVFGVPDTTPIDMLPEKNSFAKAIKQHLLSGGHIYDTNGIFF